MTDVSPDYASTGMLNEANNVYSYGVLLMEIITGRSPVDYSRPPGEVKKVLLLTISSVYIPTPYSTLFAEMSSYIPPKYLHVLTHVPNFR